MDFKNISMVQKNFMSILCIYFIFTISVANADNNLPQWQSLLEHPSFKTIQNNLDVAYAQFQELIAKDCKNNIHTAIGCLPKLPRDENGKIALAVKTQYDSHFTTAIVASTSPLAAFSDTAEVAVYKLVVNGNVTRYFTSAANAEKYLELNPGLEESGHVVVKLVKLTVGALKNIIKSIPLNLMNRLPRNWGEIGYTYIDKTIGAAAQ